jgi:hypothetical protein
MVVAAALMAVVCLAATIGRDASSATAMETPIV